MFCSHKKTDILIGMAAGIAVGALAGPFAGRTGGAHELEHAFDGVGILECHALGATQRAMLGLDA